MTTQHSPNVIDVDQAQFATEVIKQSHHQPVVVDFWAAWCGPCRTLGPMIEEAVNARDGAVRLVKVDVDANQALAQQFGIQGIPAVKGFRDGRVIAEFTGAVPLQQIEAFLDQLVPSRADELAQQARQVTQTDPAKATELYRQALSHDADHREAAVGLAELVVDEDPQRALDLVAPHRPEPGAEAVAARAEMAGPGDVDVAALTARVESDPDDAEAQWQLGRVLASQSEYAEAAEHLLAAIRLGGETREPARETLISIFTILGNDHELVVALRPRLANALF